MGTFIVVVVLVLEVVFAVYCIKTKNNQIRLRNQVRLAGFCLFIMGIVLSIIEWSFRWYLLAAMLTILAVIGCFRLFKYPYRNQPYQMWRIVARGLVMSMMVMLATIPVVVFPQYREPIVTGDYDVTTMSFTYIDESRMETFTDVNEYRQLNVTFWYPESVDETHPLVVFSHGAFGVRMSNTSTFVELASNGYVVCSIDHPYHAAGTVDDRGKLTIGSSTFMQEVIDVNGHVYDDKEEYELYQKWMDLRIADINFVIHEIQQKIEYKEANMYDKIDASKIALIGHSLGGAASTQLGRIRDDIHAVINLDGSMLGEYGMSETGDIVINEEPYPIPLLNFYSEYVINELIAIPDFVYPNRYMTSISPLAFETYIKGTNHMSYTDLPLFSPLLASQLSGMSGGDSKAAVDKYDCIETMNRLILEFFDRYVKGKGSFMVEESY